MTRRPSAVSSLLALGLTATLAACAGKGQMGRGSSARPAQSIQGWPATFIPSPAPLIQTFVLGFRDYAHRARPQISCSPLGRAVPLPRELRETSGLAVSRAHPGVLWTHNDSGNSPHLYAVDENGALLGSVRVTGATNVDWEDLALGPCPSGDCLYIGDIGDNGETREDIAIYRVPEPAPDAPSTAPAERFPIRYPDRTRDAEALLVTHAGELYVITKGRTGPVTLYRYPPPLRPDVVELEPVQQLGDRPPPLPEWVTGADVTPDGRWFLVRSYVALRFYRFHDGRLALDKDVPTINLRSLEESLGEAVGAGEDGLVVLSGEAGFSFGPSSLVRLRCPW
ncbi:MAG: hypothetical protein HY701_10840 [Gemmatimonadetes bacterium]|nr:hypothetical protein [Gemmatimonadota bacterium]